MFSLMSCRNWRRTSAALVLALLWTIAPVPAASTGSGRLAGTLQGEAAGPMTGARVLLYHLATESVYSSSPTGEEGRYELTNLPEGYYDLAVETPGGLYVADRVVHLDSPGEAALGLTARPYAEGTARREFPGADAMPVGIAAVHEPNTGGFWGKPGGISVIAGAGLAGLLVLSNSSGDDDDPVPTCDEPGDDGICGTDDDDDPASPSEP
jgi:hypothetical protein